ncbi:hypothetical protein [Undibacterium sp. Di24W]|uniref:hypothetical protein n=1 Tax=Undibacterium sp. Di24W TaxID=3413033 RepID=UPI003BF2FD60
MLSQERKKEIADFLRKAADDIENDPMLAFHFHAIGRKPDVLTLNDNADIDVRKLNRNDYEIRLSITDWSQSA